MQLLSSFGGEQMVPVSVFFTSDFVPLGKMLAANPQAGFAPTPGLHGLCRVGQGRAEKVLVDTNFRVKKGFEGQDGSIYPPYIWVKFMLF